MKIEIVNSMLRNMAVNLCEKGWAKTTVGKLLLGSNGQAHLNQWIKPDKNTGDVKDFGIKPLTKIANLIGYEPHVVFLPTDQTDENGKIILARNAEAEQYIDEQNEIFVQELRINMEECMGQSIIPRINRQNKTPLDDIIDEMINI